MSFDKDKSFHEKLNNSSNPFSDILQVATTARKIVDDNSSVLYSEAITAAVHGYIPRNKYNFLDSYEFKYIKNTFALISDNEVCNAVYDSFYESKTQNRVIYKYNKIQNPSRQTRVRVLTNMLLDALCGIRKSEDEE